MGHTELNDGKPAVSRWIWIGLLCAFIFMSMASGLLRHNGIHFIGDNAMRMVEIRDLVNGQSWFDTTQYRDNTPYGGPMHWSRLIDGPVALIIIALRPVLGVAGAEAAAQIIWPMLVFTALAILLVLTAEWLAGRAAGAFAALVAALAVPIHNDFPIAGLDHHNVQAVLAVLAMLTTLRARTSARWAVAAGLTAATIIAIATEGLPIIAAQLLVIPLFWVFDPARNGRPMLAFGASFGLGTLGHLLLVTPPAAWFEVHCDAISFTYVSVALLYALAVFISWGLWRRFGGGLLVRFIALGILGLAAMGVALWLSPECRAGPYGNLPPWLADILLTPIGEAQPIWIWLMPFRTASALVLLPVFALIAAIAAVVVDRERRADWLVVVAFAATTILVTILQVRGIRVASIIGIPAAAWAISRAWRAFRNAQSAATAARLVGTALLFMGIIHWLIAMGLAEITGTQQRVINVLNDRLDECNLYESYSRLNALPPSRLMSYLIIGPQILLNTRHSIVSAGYHRNIEGLKDEVQFFGGTEAEARAVVEKRDLDYLVTCRGIDPSEALAGVPVFKGYDWDWLTPISGPDEPLQIYRIAR